MKLACTGVNLRGALGSMCWTETFSSGDGENTRTVCGQSAMPGCYYTNGWGQRFPVGFGPQPPETWMVCDAVAPPGPVLIANPVAPSPADQAARPAPVMPNVTDPRWFSDGSAPRGAVPSKFDENPPYELDPSWAFDPRAVPGGSGSVTAPPVNVDPGAWEGISGGGFPGAAAPAPAPAGGVPWGLLLIGAAALLG